MGGCERVGRERVCTGMCGCECACTRFSLLREERAATSRSEQELLGRGSSTTSWREAGGRVSSRAAAGTSRADERAQGGTAAGVGGGLAVGEQLEGSGEGTSLGSLAGDTSPHHECLICDLGLSVKAAGGRGTLAVRGLHCALWALCGSLERPPGRQRDGEYQPHQQRPGPGQRDTHRSGGQPWCPLPGGLGLRPLGPEVGGWEETHHCTGWPGSGPEHLPSPSSCSRPTDASPSSTLGSGKAQDSKLQTRQSRTKGKRWKLWIRG